MWLLLIPPAPLTALAVGKRRGVKSGAVLQMFAPLADVYVAQTKVFSSEPLRYVRLLWAFNGLAAATTLPFAERPGSRLGSLETAELPVAEPAA